ncbi:Dolichyl-diphosphooligosaccharide--protein glycosyltransferase subunit stt3b, partial [Dionaea muscipula]
MSTSSLTAVALNQTPESSRQPPSPPPPGLLCRWPAAHPVQTQFTQPLPFINHWTRSIRFAAFQFALGRITVTRAVGLGTIAVGVSSASGYLSPWTGRFYSLLDLSYAKDHILCYHIPIIEFVSEHQLTSMCFAGVMVRLIVDATPA